MQEAAFEALGVEGWRFQLLPVPPEWFDETMRALPAAGFAGVNVTVPHKEAALALADTASDAAREIGAANTLTFAADGTIAADNTDAPGLLDALPEPPAGRTALVLGAGGSARAAVWALQRAGAEVSILARTRRRAEVLGVRMVDEPEPADLLVNCTPVGMEDEDLPAPPEYYDVVVDLVYRDGGTALIRRAEEAGARTVDGIEILVHQGALSFQEWTGMQAPLDVMRLAARGVH
jgi:shikimate dehydrogenase